MNGWAQGVTADYFWSVVNLVGCVRWLGGLKGWRVGRVWSLANLVNCGIVIRNIWNIFTFFVASCAAMARDEQLLAKVVRLMQKFQALFPSSISSAYDMHPKWIHQTPQLHFDLSNVFCTPAWYHNDTVVWICKNRPKTQKSKSQQISWNFLVQFLYQLSTCSRPQGALVFDFVTLRVPKSQETAEFEKKSEKWPFFSTSIFSTKS